MIDRRDDDDDIQRDSVRSSHSGGVAPNGSKPADIYLYVEAWGN